MPTETAAPSSGDGAMASALPTRHAGDQQQQTSSTTQPFDIADTYNRLLASNRDLTKPLAAIEALIELLRHEPPTTIQETVEMIKTNTEVLKASVANPIPLQAGTDLFQAYLLQNTKPPEPLRRGGARRGRLADHVQDFDDVIQHLINNKSLFTARAMDARTQIADRGARYVLDGRTVLTHGGSRTVTALLLKAAENRQTQGVMFNVIYVEPSSSTPSSSSSSSSSLPRDSRFDEGADMVAKLRALDVPVATVPESAVAYVLPKVERIFVGAEAVCKNGGIVSRLGTFQIACLARQFGVPLWVAAETHKIAKVFPLSQYDLKVKQDIVSFKTAEGLVEDKGVEVDDRGGVMSQFGQVEMVDYTPPELIANLITEVGIKLPSAVFEYLLDLHS